MSSNYIELFSKVK